MASDLIELNMAAALRALAAYPEIAEEEIGDALERALLVVGGDLASYPQRGPTSYRRTGTLGRTWSAARPQVRAGAGVVEGVLSNSTGYAEFVQGGDDQAWMHQGVWRTDHQIVEARQASINGYVGNAVRRIERRVNEGTA